MMARMYFLLLYSVRDDLSIFHWGFNLQSEDAKSFATFMDKNWLRFIFGAF